MTILAYQGLYSQTVETTSSAESFSQIHATVHVFTRLAHALHCYPINAHQRRMCEHAAVTIENESPSSPLSKRHRAEIPSDEYESDFPDEIFPSEDECHLSDSAEDHAAFNPSEESNPPEIMDCELTQTSTVSNTKEINCESDGELEKIGRLLVGKCCERLCLRHLTAVDIISNKSDFILMTKSNQRLYLLTKLKENSCECDTRPGSVITKYYISGKEICSSAWAQVYGICTRTLSRMLQQIVEQRELTHGNLGKKRANTKAESVAMWMDGYFNLIGDRMPDKNQIHLPSWENQKNIYCRYFQDMQKCGISEDEIAGISVFYKIWSKQFTHVVIPQVRTSLLVAEQCR